jgi:hypothetical protein
MAQIRARIREWHDRTGTSLGLALLSLTILTTVGLGLLTTGAGARHQALEIKGAFAARLAAEAGYEKAIFWMGRQQDMLTALQQGVAGTTGSLTFPESACTYQISLFSFVGARPVYRIASVGTCGPITRQVNVLVVQVVSGWDMGACQSPSGATSLTPVYFATGETIDMPVYINKANDSPDARDIFISGTPAFEGPVAVGESRRTASGADKYADVMGLFGGGISFDQPATRVTDESTVQAKVTRFRGSTKSQYIFTPTAGAGVSNPQPAVQLEFFVQNGVGKARITNNCTVRGFRQDNDSKTYDFAIHPGTNGTQFDRYYIYAYHVASRNAATNGDQRTVAISDTYVSQSFNGVQSQSGGQIFVNGNVIIGGNDTTGNNDQVVNGKITVVATGNIWVADNLLVDGAHDSDGVPTTANANVVGLLAQGVIKIVDPGLSTIDGTINVNGYSYMPIGKPDYPSAGPSDSNYNHRSLSDPFTVEAALTVGGGGWGAENVRRGSYGGRKEATGSQDTLAIHGMISEAIRGVVGVVGTDGFLKSYFMDQRLLAGLVPGDIWLLGKFVPAPGGWQDSR